jgi:hypothetical protein
MPNAAPLFITGAEAKTVSFANPWLCMMTEPARALADKRIRNFNAASTQHQMGRVPGLRKVCS